MTNKKTLAVLNKYYALPEETKEREGIKVSFPAYTIVQVSDPQKAKSEEWNETAHKFVFTIKGHKFDYYTGLGHRECSSSWGRDREEFKRLKNANLTDHGVMSLCSISRATLPTIEELFYSLVMDASACEEPFSDWCDNYGYDTDSRKALITYELCQNNGIKLRGLTSSSLSDLRDYYQNY